MGWKCTGDNKTDVIRRRKEIIITNCHGVRVTLDRMKITSIQGNKRTLT